MPNFQIMTKPMGPICNLDCKYCFYLEKEKLYPGENQWRMSDEVLEGYICQYIQSQPSSEIHFAWQGGDRRFHYPRRVVCVLVQDGYDLFDGY